MYRGTTPTITINCDIDVSEFVTMSPATSSA